MQIKQAIVFVQLTGSRGTQGTGGGLEFYERLARTLLIKGEEVYAITNNHDLLGFSFLNERRYVANFRSESEGIASIFLFNRNLLKSEMERICGKFDHENTIFVTVDPFPMDVYGANLLRRMGFNKVGITLHHITPSPFWHPWRRGISRVVVAWSISVYAILYSKLNEVPVFLDNKRIAEVTGWKIHTCFEQLLALDSYHETTPEKREPIIVFVGRLTYNKGVIDLLEAYARIKRQMPETRLILMGTNFLKNKIERLAGRLFINESIEIMGFLPNSERDRIMNRASIMLFPSYEEGWALSVMEAVDHGVLPVTYDIPAYDYLGSEAVKVKLGKVKDLAEKALFYLENKQERERKVLILQKEIKKYTMEYVSNHWLSQIKSAYDGQ